MEMTGDGELPLGQELAWAKFGPGGLVSYRGTLFFRTASQKLARLNNACDFLALQLHRAHFAHRCEKLPSLK
jgi:hypothetical protein